MRDHTPGYQERLLADIDRCIKEWDGKLIVLPSVPKVEPRRLHRLEKKALNQLGRRWRETKLPPETSSGFFRYRVTKGLLTRYDALTGRDA